MYKKVAGLLLNPLPPICRVMRGRERLKRKIDLTENSPNFPDKKTRKGSHSVKQRLWEMIGI